MSFRLGLTGGIGMGKTTTAALFASHGVPVWDADAAVHRMYEAGGAAVAPVGRLFPAALTASGIDRGALKRILAQQPGRLADLESIVHPLVADDRAAFMDAHRDAPVVLLDIPLLFETGAERALDGIAVVSAPPEVQRARVLARPGMTDETLSLILSRQMPDAEKRARADWVIPTDTPEAAAAAVRSILAQIGGRGAQGGNG